MCWWHVIPKLTGESFTSVWEQVEVGSAVGWQALVLNKLSHHGIIIIIIIIIIISVVVIIYVLAVCVY